MIRENRQRGVLKWYRKDPDTQIAWNGSMPYSIRKAAVGIMFIATAGIEKESFPDLGDAMEWCQSFEDKVWGRGKKR